MQMLQHPIPSGFGPKTTAEEALGATDLSGKLAIVTGGYAGLGLETVRVLVKAGATVVIPARDVEKARAALDGMPRIEIGSLDLADPASIDAFARDFVASGRSVDLLINNAGVMATPLSHDARGYERQFATNHLGHFQLAGRLWPSLLKSGKARVIALSSGGHRFAGVDFDDPNYQRRAYDAWKAYGQAKTANALFAVGLDKRGQDRGVRAFSVHPGVIMTELTRYVSLEDMQAIGFRDAEGNLTPFLLDRMKTVEQGAATTIWCATSPQLDGMGGLYCEDCDVSPALPADSKELYGVSPWAIDPNDAERLWALSEELTGVSYGA
ncbi:oxidoreductase [Rhizobium sp. BK376]|uniref:oxidoreductase n=1 Tax=Rhizobium sp. BK376 TaxID=2512149 RepID=UPI001051B1D1|nr:oxidoreductase [Rhizobium sp. BK376]TCR91742.1 NAD(P)-dependent dehydrogenase (short-subunit alcohol dehydrogenase family) [Rhizobium sp. BK376]